MSYGEELQEKILSELVEIKQLLLLNSRDIIKQELNQVASTDERRKIWGLMDGLTSTSEIAETVKITPRTVQIFITQLEEKELVVTEKRGYPKRRMDYIPSDWRLEEVKRIE